MWTACRLRAQDTGVRHVEAQVPGPGWYDDGTGQTRWWDGAAWTQHVAPTPEPSVPAAPDARAEASEPLRPGAPDPKVGLPPEDRAPDVPATEQTFVPSSFVTEQSFQPQLAHAGAGAASAASITSYLAQSPEPAAVPGGGGSRFGGVAGPTRGGLAPIEHTPIVVSSGRGRGVLIALGVLFVLGVLGLTAWRIFGPDNAPKATPEVVAAAVQSAAPKGSLPKGFVAAGEVGGFRVLKECPSAGSCRTVQLAARTTCKSLSALVLFAGSYGQRLGSDVVQARNVKAGKAVTLKAIIPAAGATKVRVSSVVCEQF